MSQDLQGESANWRHRKTNGVVLSLRVRKSESSSWSQRQGNKQKQKQNKTKQKHVAVQKYPGKRNSLLLGKS